ncbi:MAG TPA: serine/threonine-protein kinase [Gemmatimonadaceae bacterium]
MGTRKRSDEFDVRDAVSRKLPPDLDSNAPTRTASDQLLPGSREAGEIWGGLRILDELGRGGFGRVYRAWDDTLAREVALKIIRVSPVDPDLVAGVLSEGRLLARVRHRNVVTVFGATQIDDEIGLWMELVRGRSLAEIVRDDGPLGAGEAALIGNSLGHALAAVHAAGLLHRDVKANNVMREAGGRIVLMDFGAGRDLTAAGHRDRSEFSGTPIYMAPEVLTGGQASASADVYSLGVLLFFLVTGRFPIEGRGVGDIVVAHSLGNRRLLSDVRPDLPDGFVRVVERMLTADPAERYQSAGAMLHDLTESTAADSPDGTLAANLPVDGAAGPASTRQTPSRIWRPDSSTTAVAPTVGPIVLRRAAASAAILLLIWTLGFLTSAAFDQVLGRTEFSDDTPLTWLTWGIRSIVSPALYALLAILAIRIAASLTQAVGRLLPPVGHAAARVRRRVAGGVSRLATTYGAGQLLVLAQVVSVFVVWLLFRDLIGAFTQYVNTADASALRPLSPQNTQVLYRTVLTLLLLAMATAWYHVWMRQPSPERPDRVTLVGGLAAMTVVLLLLEVPYRVVFWPDFQRVDFAGARCYLLGEARGTLLVHCPDSAPPRNAVVDQDDPRVIRRGVIENLFTRVP